MKVKSSRTRRALRAPLSFAASVTLIGSSLLHGQHWTGSQSNFWNQSANWSGAALPSTSQSASFNAVVDQLVLSLGSNQTVAGLTFTSDATSAYTIGSFNDFTLTLNGQATQDVQIEAGSAAHTVLSKLQLSGTQSWDNASDQVFTAAGDINFSTSSVTFTNAGSGGFVLGSDDAELRNLNAGDLTFAVGNTGAEVDLTIKGQLFLTNSSSNRTLRIQAATGSVVNIDAGLSGNDGVTGTGNAAFAVSSGGTINLNATKTYTGTTTINNGTTLNVNAAITNGGIWDIDGGILNWNVTNTTMGALYFGGGPANSSSTLNIKEGVTMNLGSNVVAESEVAHSGASFMNGGVLALNGNRNFEIRDSRNTTEELTVTTSIVDGNAASNLTKTRNGTLILAGTNSYTGNTSINEGTLILDHRTLNTQKISSTGTLSLGGGILWVKGHDEEMTNVTVKDLNLNGMGGNQILLNPGSDAGIRMSFGGITRANTSGGTIRFHLLGDSEIATTATNTQNGILGSWATATVETGDYFAVVQDGKIQALNTADFASLNIQVNHQVGHWQTGANVVVEGDAVGSNNDLDLNSLRFTGSADLVLADRLRVQSGGLLIDSATTATKISNGRISIGSNSNNFEFKIHQNAQQAFEISSSFERFDNSANGHLDITKSGSGELILSGRNYTGNRATVASNGTVRVVEGTLTLRGGNAISDNSTVNMDARTGALLKLEDDETIGTLQGGSVEGGHLEVGANTLTIQQGSNATYNGAFSGSGTIIKQNLSPRSANAQLTLSVSSNNAFTGHVVVNSGVLSLAGSNVSNFANASSITVQKYGSLLLDANDTSSMGNKINNTGSVILNSANGAMRDQIAFRGLSLRNNQNATREEAFGHLVLNSGANYALIEATNVNSGNVAILTASNLTRNHQSTLAVRGNNLGAASNRRGLLRLASAQEAGFRSAQMSGDQGAANSTNMSIVRWAIAQDLGTNAFQNVVGSTQVNLQLGNSLATYVNGQGFRALNFNTEYATFATAAGGFKNVRESLSADLSGVTSKSLNALVINNSSSAARTLMGAGLDTGLYLHSGTMLFTALQSDNGNALPITTIPDVASGAVAHGVTLGDFNSGITTGSGEYVIFQNNLAAAGVTIASDFASEAKFTKSGLGTLILTGNNQAMTDVALNEGVVQISNLNQLGGSDGKLIFGGGTLRLSSGFTGDLSAKTIEVIGESYQAGSHGGRMGTLDTNGVSLTFHNNLSGSGEFVKTGIGTLTLSASTASTHNGNFVVEHTGSGSQNGAVAQLRLDNSGGHAIGGHLQIGSYVLPSAKGSASVELARSEQIIDSAIISFYGGSEKNAYFSLRGFDETVAGIYDISGSGVIQVDVPGGTVEESTLTLAGDGDYFYSGFVRNRSSGTGSALHLVHSGTGRQTLAGSNISYTGSTSNTAGTLQYRNAYNFKGNLANEATLEFEQASTGAWNYSGVISGAGHFVKTGEGTGTTTLSGVNTSTGTVTVKSGELTLGTTGRIDDVSAVEVYRGASFKLAQAYTYYGKVAGNGTVVGDLSLSRKTGSASSAAELRPGAASQAFSSSAAGNLLGHLQIDGNLTLTGGTTVGDDTGARAILQIGAATLNDAAGILNAVSSGNLATYLNAQAAASWNALSLVDSVSGNTKHDSVTLTGKLTWEAGSTMRIEATNDFNPVYGDVFDLFDWSELLTGSADWGTFENRRDGGLIGDLFLPVLRDGLSYDLSAFGTHGIVAVIPEPSRTLTVAVALLFLGLRRRRA